MHLSCSVFVGLSKPLAGEKNEFQSLRSTPRPHSQELSSAQHSCAHPLGLNSCGLDHFALKWSLVKHPLPLLWLQIPNSTRRHFTEPDGHVWRVMPLLCPFFRQGKRGPDGASQTQGHLAKMASTVVQSFGPGPMEMKNEWWDGGDMMSWGAWEAPAAEPSSPAPTATESDQGS